MLNKHNTLIISLLKERVADHTVVVLHKIELSRCLSELKNASKSYLTRRLYFNALRAVLTDAQICLLLSILCLNFNASVILFIWHQTEKSHDFSRSAHFVISLTHCTQLSINYSNLHFFPELYS